MAKKSKSAPRAKGREKSVREKLVKAASHASGAALSGKSSKTGKAAKSDKTKPVQAVAKSSGVAARAKGAAQSAAKPLAKPLAKHQHAKTGLKPSGKSGKNDLEIQTQSPAKSVSKSVSKSVAKLAAKPPAAPAASSRVVKTPAPARGNKASVGKGKAGEPREKGLKDLTPEPHEDDFAGEQDDEFLAEDLDALNEPDVTSDDGSGGRSSDVGGRAVLGKGSQAQNSVAESESEDEAPAEKKPKKKDEVKIDRTGDLEGQWKTLFERTKGIKPIPYKMSENYEAKTPLLHKVLGWGYVLTSQNNRLEVLFKEGIKFLISNYKAP